MADDTIIDYSGLRFGFARFAMAESAMALATRQGSGLVCVTIPKTPDQEGEQSERSGQMVFFKLLQVINGSPCHDILRVEHKICAFLYQEFFINGIPAHGQQCEPADIVSLTVFRPETFAS